jgi:hypothetical protein
VVHIGRNRCKSATGAANSQGHDWTPIYSIFPNDSSELLLYLGLERNNSDDACHPLYRSTTKHNTWEARHDTGDRSLGIVVLGQLAKVLPTKHPTMAAHV